jgi:hypothetical protein
MSDRRQYPVLWSLISFTTLLTGNRCRWKAVPLYLDNGHERICDGCGSSRQPRDFDLLDNRIHEGSERRRCADKASFCLLNLMRPRLLVHDRQIPDRTLYRKQQCRIELWRCRGLFIILLWVYYSAKFSCWVPNTREHMPKPIAAIPPNETRSPEGRSRSGGRAELRGANFTTGTSTTRQWVEASCSPPIFGGTPRLSAIKASRRFHVTKQFADRKRPAEPRYTPRVRRGR